jgi:hypothetical protein
MSKIPVWALAFAGASLVSNVLADGFADTVINYSPGTGFSSGFTNPATVLGSPTSTATPFAPAFQKTQLLSIGAGGSVTVQFDTPIQNDPSHPFGLDFTIYGNSFFVESGTTATGSIFGSTPGSTQVLVSQDGVNFYTLNPALAPTVNYAFPTDGAGDPTMPINPTLTPGNFTGLDLNGIRSLYNGSAGGSSYDISWAEDSQGNSVSLSSIDYVEVEVLSGKAQVDAFSEVPEPTTWALLALGLASLAWRFRNAMPRRRASIHTTDPRS